MRRLTSRFTLGLSPRASLGRVRTSTWVLEALFLITLVTYLLVRPTPVPAGAPSNGPVIVVPESSPSRTYRSPSARSSTPTASATTGTPSPAATTPSSTPTTTPTPTPTTPTTSSGATGTTTAATPSSLP